MPSRCPCTCPLVARELISPLQTIDLALAFMREKNTGLTPDGKTFGEVIDHFFAGGDETCLLVRRCCALVSLCLPTRRTLQLHIACCT